MKRFAIRAWGLLLAACAGCAQPESDKVQGYVEGEYVYVSSPHAGALRALFVRRGALVSAGETLFALDEAPEKLLRDEAARKVEAQIQEKVGGLTGGLKLPGM